MGSLTIGIAGGTGSGKSTVARIIRDSFGEDVALLKCDDYYKAHHELSLEERSKMNYDHPDAFDTGLRVEHIRALKGGVKTDMIFELVRELRSDVTVPMVFMTYANVVFSYGAEKFISTCRDLEIDGLILPDLPFEEKEEFRPLCKRYGVDLISLIAPTSMNRIAMIAKEAEGFLYLVSSLGVTGMRTEITTDLASIVKVVRENTEIPCAIGFGISTPEQAAKMAGLSDGVIVGSAIIKLLEKYGKNAPEQIGAYIMAMKEAMR